MPDTRLTRDRIEALLQKMAGAKIVVRLLFPKRQPNESP